VFVEDGLEARAVAVVAADQALLETRRAFDRVAPAYDRSNRENEILCEMRRRARAELERFAPPGSRLLDLGCGPGTDAVPLAEQGYHVTAIDWSPAMVAEAQRRVRAAGLGHRVRVLQLGIHELERLAPARVDAAYSNFGPLNCVPAAEVAAQAIAARLRTGGVLVATVIGRWCPWEIAFYLSRGAWRRALVRVRREAVPVPLEGGIVWTRYYSPREFAAAFYAAGFTLEHVRALSLFAPPPYLAPFAARHPAFVARLRHLDDSVGTWPILRSAGDHFLIVLRWR
jgi:SAM-dependent methyltransferase